MGKRRRAPSDLEDFLDFDDAVAASGDEYDLSSSASSSDDDPTNSETDWPPSEKDEDVVDDLADLDIKPSRHASKHKKGKANGKAKRKAATDHEHRRLRKRTKFSYYIPPPEELGPDDKIPLIPKTRMNNQSKPASPANGTRRASNVMSWLNSHSSDEEVPVGTFKPGRIVGTTEVKKGIKTEDATTGSAVRTRARVKTENAAPSAGPDVRTNASDAGRSVRKSNYKRPDIEDAESSDARPKTNTTSKTSRKAKYQAPYVEDEVDATAAANVARALLQIVRDHRLDISVSSELHSALTSLPTNNPDDFAVTSVTVLIDKVQEAIKRTMRRNLRWIEEKKHRKVIGGIVFGQWPVERFVTLVEKLPDGLRKEALE